MIVFISKGDCDHVTCVPDNWTSWSSVCGKASRSRKISAVQTKTASYNCEGLKQTCDKSEQVEDRETLCKCFEAFLRIKHIYITCLIADFLDCWMNSIICLWHHFLLVPTLQVISMSDNRAVRQLRIQVFTHENCPIIT